MNRFKDINYVYNNCTTHQILSDMLDKLLENRPEIVRCKDCKHGDIVDVYDGKMVECRCDEGRIYPLEWFCPDGEVKRDDA